MNIRLLNADEIECRVAQVSKSQYGVSCSLLLYKDARCDMSILDEVYGQTNWKREHVIIDGRLYCNVSVWDAEKGQWVVKQDVGTESNAEKEKGQASDSFKRACTNWGIGRELYTAPMIWVRLRDKEYSEQNGRIKCKQSFRVRSIQYDKRRISGLVIEDEKGEARFELVPPPVELTEVQKKAKHVKQLLYDISGKDVDTSSKLWREQYQKDENDIVKMNAAILELEPKWNAIKAEQHKAVQNDA